MNTRLALALALNLSSCQAPQPSNADDHQATPGSETPAQASPPSSTPITGGQLGGPSVVDPPATALPTSPTPTVGGRFGDLSIADPPAIAIISSRWSTCDPRDPTIPALVQPSDGAFQVDPAWEVDRIEYVYEWWGQGESTLDYQVVRRDGDAYYLDSVKIDAGLITSLIASLGDLHPSQYTLVALSTIDSYPSWRMELVGKDGRRLLVYSSSTGNSGAAPWNVLDNGRLFVQYRGDIAKPISNLLGGPYGGPAAVFYPSVGGSDRVLFATAGLPPQLSEGFEGLLLVSEGFQYSADAISGTIRAFLQGRSPSGGFGNKKRGEITALDRARLTAPDGAAVPCTVDQLEAADPSLGSWSMVCDIGDATPGSRFRFPLQLDASTSEGRELVIDGALVGVWDSERRTVLLPPPDDVASILAANGPAARVLRDHPLSLYNYAASRSADGILTVSGEVILLGDLELEGHSIAYTLATPFSVQHGSIEWALTKDELGEFVLDVAQTPVVARALASFSDVTLNLCYSEVLDLPEMPMLLNNTPPNYSVSLAECGDESALSAPDPQHSLRGFSLNGPWSFDRPEFVLDHGTPRISNLDLEPLQDGPYSFILVPAPPESDTRSEPLFARVWVQSDSFLEAGPELTLQLPRGIDPRLTEPYKSILTALPVLVEPWADNIWVARGMTLVVLSDGSLRAVACSGQSQ